MNFRKSSKIPIFVSLALTSVLLVGCVVSNTEVKCTGVEDEILKQIECGKTTKNWLVATFGKPTEQRVTQEGTEILSYKCTKKQDNRFVLFPIVIVDDEKETEYTISFELKDDIVQRCWKEGVATRGQKATKPK